MHHYQAIWTTKERNSQWGANRVLSPATVILFHPPRELQRYSVCINAVMVNFTMVTGSPAVSQCVYTVTDSFGWSQIVTSVAALRMVHTGVTTSWGSHLCGHYIYSSKKYCDLYKQVQAKACQISDSNWWFQWCWHIWNTQPVQPVHLVSVLRGTSRYDQWCAAWLLQSGVIVGWLLGNGCG